MFIEFGLNVAATVLGGLILAFTFFWVREKVFPMRNLSGRWDYRIDTITSSYNPYKNMILGYSAMIWQEGAILKGTAEKVYENSSTGRRNFEGSNRTRASIEGYIKKNYFSSDKVFLHIVEDGHGRESTTVFDLGLDSKGGLRGRFNSLVADQSGTVKFQRVQY